MNLHILARQFLRKATNSPNLVVNKSWHLYNLSLGSTGMLLVDQIVLQATLHTMCEIFHPILLFGSILLLNLCDLPHYTLILHYTFIRHTRVCEEFGHKTR